MHNQFGFLSDLISVFDCHVPLSINNVLFLPIVGLFFFLNVGFTTVVKKSKKVGLHRKSIIVCILHFPLTRLILC